jgi:hypothetical protein
MQQLTDICISVTEGANVLTDGCLKAADEAPEDNLREQFRLCLKSVTAAVNTFCGSIKFLKDKPTETNYKACQVLYSVHVNVHIYKCLVDLVKSTAIWTVQRFSQTKHSSTSAVQQLSSHFYMLNGVISYGVWKRLKKED